MSAVALAGCNRTAPTVTEPFLMEFLMPQEFKAGSYYSGQKVYMSGTASYEFETSLRGMVSVESVIPGIYDITTGMEISGAQYKALLKEPVAIKDDARINIGISLINQRIFSGQDLRFQLTAAALSSLVISKIYYSGTKDDMGRNYTADSYVEIFNNSDEVQYLDGKYLGIADGSANPAYFPVTENPDSIFLKQLCKFPGSGTEHPVQPGASIVIAASSARNHTLSAATSVDLSGADYEVKGMEGSGNPDVPMLPIVSNTYASLLEFNLTTSGPNAVMLIETDENPLDWPECFRVGKTSGDRWRRMHKKWVVDGVECLKKQATADPDVQTKRLQDEIDAGYVVISSVSGYSNESVDRKVAREANGRYYLVDTNNSSADFAVCQDPSPRKYDKEGLK